MVDSIQEHNEANVLKLVQQISSFIDEYDQSDKIAGIADFSEKDPSENVKKGLAEKLSSEQQKDFAESEEEADRIVKQVENVINEPNFKQKFCAALKVLSGDLNNVSKAAISGIIAGLIAEGAITLPLITAIPGLNIAVVVILCSRMSIAFYCAKDDKSS